MKRRSPFQILVLVLCVLALLGAQIFGGPLRFFCDCGGRVVATQSAHCFGPDHTHCHTDGKEVPESHEGKNPVERKEHQIARDEVQVRPGEWGQHVAVAPVWIALEPALEAFFVAPEPMVVARPAADDGDSPPAAGVVVARTVVFLI